MIRTLAYKVCRIIGRHIESQPAPETSARQPQRRVFQPVYERTDQTLLQERSVGFYAGRCT